MASKTVLKSQLDPVDTSSLLWLLWTFKSQQMYLQLKYLRNPMVILKRVFEVIQNILESIFDIALRQRQKHSVHHEIARKVIIHLKYVKYASKEVPK